MTSMIESSPCVMPLMPARWYKGCSETPASPPLLPPPPQLLPPPPAPSSLLPLPLSPPPPPRPRPPPPTAPPLPPLRPLLPVPVRPQIREAANVVGVAATPAASLIHAVQNL
eukprot:NODE_12788_length_1204_cov_3.658310.p4 GENE.NODE_12788_length_1204_cov_3.658310~~NODE_12788_length_1204_cov_3.658310.p4  ORF type:complete len:112 (-),score=26.88 NODE_12788_length_1204_cov_3.658310:9-344(-)